MNPKFHNPLPPNIFPKCLLCLKHPNNPKSPQTPLPHTPLFRLKPKSSPPINAPTPLLTPAIQPLLQILTLTHIEALQLGAALHYSLNAYPCDTNAAANGEFPELEEMQADATEGGVGDGGAAEGEFEGCELWTTEREDLGCRVGEGAAE